jgi:serine/threonine protein kinase/tetratricopeptide (TPR) repeat protein
MATDEPRDDRTQPFAVPGPGAVILHYKIIEKIGSGGMGEVYLALDTTLNRKVALKFLPSHLAADAEMRVRFSREAQAVAKLSHPNVVTIYEVSEFEGRPFFAMEHIEGKSLRERLKEGELDQEEVVDLALQICNGLDKAHQAGITHRDVKPSNVVIDADGRPRLLDFGLAAIEGAKHVTRAGSTLGTIGYMSPEQIQAKEVDRRSDLFSFGVVLYQMITGHLPFTGPNEAAIMNAVLNNKVEPLSRYKSGVTDELQGIVTKLLEKDRELRYQSAAGVISDLKRLRRDSDRSLVAPAPSSRRRTTAWYLIPVSLVVILTVVVLTKPWEFGRQPALEVPADSNRLAIMYFDNLADPADSQKLGEIAASLLITDLSESRYVQVVSTQRLYDILKLLGHEGVKKIDPGMALQVAEKAHAKWMLQGSILRAKPEIELAAQLVDVSSGNTVAGQRIKGSPGESIFSLVDKLTVAVKGDLSLPEAASTEADQPVANVTTHSPEAYRYYLEGVENMFRFYFPEAERALKKAVELDSTFAMAYYRLAELSSGADQREKIGKALEFSRNVNNHERLTIEALAAYVNGHTETAIEKCREFLKRYPDDKEMYFNLGNLYRLGPGNLDSAIYYYSKALELDSLYAPVYNILAYCYDEDGDFDRSIWAINKYIELDPDQANPYDSRAELYAAAGKIDEAIASYRKAIEIKPDFYMSWQGLGAMHVYRQEYEKAKLCFEKLMENPRKGGRSNGRRDLAILLTYQGRLREALDFLKQSIAADRMEKADPWEKELLAARIYATQGAVPEALTAMQQAIDDFPANQRSVVPVVHFYIKTLAENNRMEEARKALAEWKESMTPDDSSVLAFWWVGAGCLERAAGNYQSAIRYFRAAMDRFKIGYAPVEIHARYLLARAYQDNGQLGEAVDEFGRLLSNYSEGRLRYPIETVKLHYYLGKAYEESGWDDKAIEQYKIFIDIWKNADSGLTTLADANERLTRLENRP